MDIDSDANISIKSAFLYRDTTIIDKILSINRHHNNSDYDWHFI